MDWLTDLMAEAGYTTTLELPYTDPNGTFSIPSGAHNFFGPEITNSANEGEPLLTALLAQFIIEKGGEIRFNTKAEYLIREDNGAGRVSAVIATDQDGNHIRFEGSKAIVLATGDYSANRDMMAKYCNAFQDFVMVNPDDYDAEFQFGGLMPGDGHKMGLWVGAAWQYTTPSAPMIGWYGFPAPNSDENHPGILLNAEGKRFMNEDSTSVYAGYAIQGQTNKSVFTVWDSQFAYAYDTWNGLGVNMDYLGLQPMTSAEKAADFEQSVENGVYYKADTIEEVLKKLSGIDVNAALASIEAYNGFVERGVDPEYRKNPVNLHPITTGPFYAAQSTMGPEQFLCVSGGLRTNENSEVLDESCAAIPGLYMVGSGAGDVFGTFYNFRVPGMNLGLNCVTPPYYLGKDLGR
jgi:succinate dehydrogenase/fumarate reductase flavoprotein subunit